ncbi:unnamed protein product [Musa hybrid cultivar]
MICREGDETFGSFGRRIDSSLRLHLLGSCCRVILFFLRKKRRTNRDVEAKYAGLAMAFPSLCCWKGQSDESYTVLEPQQVSISSNGAAYSDDERRHLRSNSTKDMFAMPFGGEDTEDAELWCYAGPSRLLFTIIEEEEEDLETEDGESTVGENTERSAERTLRNMLEMSQEDDSTLMPSSPPPTLKFLMDAEEKHYKKRLMDEALKVQRSCNLNESREKKEASVAPHPPVAASSPTGTRSQLKGQVISPSPSSPLNITSVNEKPRPISD